MPKELLAPGNAGAAYSLAFIVNPAEGPRGVSATGLSGAETMTVCRDNGAGFVALTDTSAILTVAQPASSIIASGKYLLRRSAGSAGAYID